MDQKNLFNLLGFWVVSVLLLAIFSALYVNDVVLGNVSVTKPVATLANGLVIAIVTYFVPSLVKYLDLKLKFSDEKVALITYFVVNLVVLWVLKRMADYTGLGIASILHVIVIALVLAILQVGVKRYSSKLLKSAK